MGLYGERKHHDDNAEWRKHIGHIEMENQHAPVQQWSDVSLEETLTAIQKSSNWKAPGIDGIENFWLKHMPALHKDLTYAYNKCIENPEDPPCWLTTGPTYLLPKNEETKTPQNYRPYQMPPYNVQNPNIHNS